MIKFSSDENTRYCKCLMTRRLSILVCNTLEIVVKNAGSIVESQPRMKLFSVNDLNSFDYALSLFGTYTEGFGFTVVL